MMGLSLLRPNPVSELVRPDDDADDRDTDDDDVDDDAMSGSHLGSSHFAQAARSNVQAGVPQGGIRAWALTVVPFLAVAE